MYYTADKYLSGTSLFASKKLRAEISMKIIKVRLTSVQSYLQNKFLPGSKENDEPNQQALSVIMEHENSNVFQGLNQSIPVQVNNVYRSSNAIF